MGSSNTEYSKCEHLILQGLGPSHGSKMGWRTCPNTHRIQAYSSNRGGASVLLHRLSQLLQLPHLAVREADRNVLPHKLPVGPVLQTRLIRFRTWMIDLSCNVPYQGEASRAV